MCIFPQRCILTNQERMVLYIEEWGVDEFYNHQGTEMDVYRVLLSRDIVTLDD